MGAMRGGRRQSKKRSPKCKRFASCSLAVLDCLLRNKWQLVQLRAKIIQFNSIQQLLLRLCVRLHARCQGYGAREESDSTPALKELTFLVLGTDMGRDNGNVALCYDNGIYREPTGESNQEAPPPPR